MANSKKFKIIRWAMERPDISAVLLYDGTTDHHTVTGVQLRSKKRQTWIESLAGWNSETRNQNNRHSYLDITREGGMELSGDPGYTYTVWLTPDEGRATTKICQEYSINKADARIHKEIQERGTPGQQATERAWQEAAPDGQSMTIQEAATSLLHRASHWATDAGWLLSGNTAEQLTAWELSARIESLASEIEKGQRKTAPGRTTPEADSEQ